ncbi:MAG TPA: serine/threonine-protein kinase, partial [Planctomycetota bacterium]|nr:serine/threonine-protein kinase [Planctomycetota bacterium]
MSARAVWGDYEVFLDEVLGRGGMGCVYRARQISLGRDVAVKVLDFSNLSDPGLARGFVERFQVEVRALARLNNPRIVTILQAGHDDGRFWFAMELLDGPTLEQRLERGGPVPEREARRVGSEVARALEAAHRAGIIHRDVKPANIFLLADGRVKLADFGLARSEALMRTRLTEAGAMTCTPAYASPEQVEGRPMDHRGDIYSLGCVLYEMVTQRPPFLADSAVETLMKHRTDRPPSSRLLNPSTTQDYEAVVARCLEKNPEDRWPSYDALVEALEAGLSGSARLSAPARVPVPPPVRRWSWPGGLAAAAGAAAFALLLAVVYSDAPATAPEAGTG